jgi:hypothetical protein
LLCTVSVLVFSCASLRNSRGNEESKLVNVDSGWARNSVNTTVFRKNSLVSFGDTQYIAYYNPERFVVLGKRKIGERDWNLKQTSYTGNAADAHNVISVMIDGDGYLHVAWDHHNNRLHYARGLYPGSLELGAQTPMTGNREARVSYPEFYKLADGNLLFLYRDGGSGNGSLVMNRYDRATKKWTTLQSNLIDGEGARNAYWQACIDDAGTIHLSWVWRESPDVASNHDLCYARSRDGGITWERSNGTVYQLPITMASAELACAIPQKSELINQTSMFADGSGLPFIATYWRDSASSIPQYRLVYKTGASWQVQNLAFRKTAFSLSGAGTKRIPISRPQIISWPQGKDYAAALVFRDEERGSKISLAVCTDLQKGRWTVRDIYNGNVGSWEPTYDTELWKQRSLLHLFVQCTEQADAEGQTKTPPQMVQVLEWKPKL